jgi:hypothetical protein
MPFIRPIREFRTIRQLLGGAERLAQESGEAVPGAEHLLLAALALSGGAARRAFERLHVDPRTLPAAIASQHADALDAVGIDLGESGHLDVPAPPGRGPFRATPAAQAAFQRAVQLSGPPKPRRLREPTWSSRSRRWSMDRPPAPCGRWALSVSSWRQPPARSWV